jgi:amino acid adenylation domain-containing protein
MRYPLSSHQERLWFIDRFEAGNLYPASPLYHNLPLILHVRGPLDGVRAAVALRRLADRHAALRTRMVSEAGEPAQAVDESLDMPMPELALGAEAGFEAALDAAVAEASRPFVAQGGPLVRAALLRYGAGESLIVVTLHHLIADRASLHILARDFGEIMRSTAEGLPPAAHKPEVPYSDYSEWQRSLSAEALEPLLFYWKWQLRGKLAALELPSARPRPAIHTFTGARHTFAWDAALAESVRAFAAREQVEPAAVTLAAFKVLLHRYARQEEIVVGTSEPRRRAPGTERIVGPLANLVVLRTQLGGNPPFRTLLGEVARTMRDAREHQEMPFDSLVRALKPAADMSRTALFDVLFGHDEEPLPEIGLGEGVVARIVETNLGFGKYDLNLALQAGRGGTFAGTLVYNADFHDAWFIAQMMRHLERLLREAMADPDTGIDDLPLLSAQEEEKQLVEWNATAAGAPRESTLHDLFAAQAGRTPERIALSHGETRLTYAELEARANRLAHFLQGQGVGRETLVAVCLERSPELIVALLAILKAGGAYLPLNPAAPRERLLFTVRDAEVAHLVTTASLAEKFGAAVAQVIRLDTDAAAIAEMPAHPPESAARPEDLAYCIYTSGSTGEPKGVLIEHRQVTRLMFNDRMPFAFREDDVWTLFHSCCFDFSVWEMYGALLYGGRLAIVPLEIARDPVLFARLVEREQVTVLNQTPTAFSQFAREALRGSPAALALRCVIFGGEALAPRQLQAFRAAYPSVRLVNMYGITETTVHVTHAEIGDEEIAQSVSNIGRPIPTTTTYLFDEKLRLVPVGVAGELCVGGEGVARGYLRRDELTRQRFITHLSRPGERLYRSGDLARHLPDGRLVYLGRLDDQVQIRGFRVELGEIKARLLAHPAVNDAEVVARSWREGEAPELAAYLVTDGEISAEALQRHLRETLPDYMVPRAFVPMPVLPLTVNGKVDRRALPEPVDVREGGRNGYTAPRDATEEKLAALWEEVLQRERVGIRDSFFDLGGHSLLAMQMMARVRETFGVELPLRHVFEAPTIEAFAAIVTAGAVSGPLPAIPKAARRSSAAAVG